MKKWKFLSLLLFFFISTGSFSQSKLFTVNDAAGLNPSLYPSTMQQLQWVDRQNTYSYTEGNFLLSGSPGLSDRDTLLTIAKLNQALAGIGADSLSRFPQINWTTASGFYFSNKQKVFTYDLNQGKAALLLTLPEDADFTEFHSASNKMAYTIGNNLFVTDGGKHIQITSEPDGVVSGQTVHRNEFGIEKGIFWSSDGSKVAFYRMDESMVDQYPLVDMNQRVATLNSIRYPMAGLTSHHVTVGVYDLILDRTIFLETGEPFDQYLTNLTWGPDGKTIFLGILNREQNHLKLNNYDAGTGRFLNTLFEESDEAYVEPLHPLYFAPGSPEQFIWNSQRDGFNHLYLYSTDGKLIRQLTKGKWVVTDVIGFDAANRHVYYMSTMQSPIERQLHRVNLKNGRNEQLSRDKGMHRVMLSYDGDYFIDVYSNTSTSRVYQLVHISKKQTEVLLDGGNPLKEYKMGATSLFTIPASDGTPLYCRLIKPVDFNPATKYPVIVYVYGGPHAQLVTESWLGGANHYLNYLAQKGFVVFTLDNRGSANRGAAFEQVIHRRLGQTELEDQMTGIAYLKNLPFVDADRIGVDGWSYGGFMSLLMKLKHPEVFKVSVAGGPVIDWKYYEVMYGERYMDSPESNPDGYAQACLVNLAGNLSGKALIIHGDNDPVVVMQHSMSFLKKCIDEGKQPDFFVYPGHEHNIRGKNRSHLVNKITNYFEENL